MKYYNMKSVYGIETIDEINPKDYISYKEYRKELTRLRNEYRTCGMDVYISSRSTKDWREKN
jgi:hypothetical protein